MLTDPLCVVQNYLDNITEIHSHHNAVASILTKTGSHLPFYEGLFMRNWAEKVAFEFFDAYLLIEINKVK